MRDGAPLRSNYRALGNAGVWCVGRLQTDADSERVVDGLASVDGGATGSARERAAVVKRLSARWFVMRDAHAGGQPFFLQPRWAMSRLRGPMTRLEIQRARQAWTRPLQPPRSSDVTRYAGTLDFEGRRREALATALRAAIPRHSPDTLLVATWNLRELDTPDYGVRSDECLGYIAQVIASFELVALQEVREDLSALRRLIAMLGPHWSFLVTDVAEGPAGNGERVAYLYDTESATRRTCRQGRAARLSPAVCAHAVHGWVRGSADLATNVCHARILRGGPRGRHASAGRDSRSGFVVLTGRERRAPSTQPA